VIFAPRKIIHESLNLIIDKVLPEGGEKYFEVVKHESDIDNLPLYLDELNIIHEEYKELEIGICEQLERESQRIFQFFKTDCLINNSLLYNARSRIEYLLPKLWIMLYNERILLKRGFFLSHCMRKLL
jgi:hypothetical protein